MKPLKEMGVCFCLGLPSLFISEMGLFASSAQDLVDRPAGFRN